MISFLISPISVIYPYHINNKNDISEPNFLGVKKLLEQILLLSFFHIFLINGEPRLKYIGFSLFYPNSKLMRYIVGGISNIPKRYPTIINAHANKKIRVKVLVINNFQEPEFSFFFFINKYILWRFIDIDSKSASAVISNQIPIIYLSIKLIFFIFS